MPGMSRRNQKNNSSDQRYLLLSDMPAKTMKKIGLTGVMGAGKSSVIAILKEKGITVLDCDAINAKLLEKGEEGYLKDVYKRQL